MPPLSATATTPPEFAAAVRDVGTTATVIVAGEVDMASADRLAEAIERAIRRRPETLVVDLAAVTFMDTCGAHLLLATTRRADEHGVRFVVAGAGAVVVRVTELCGIADLVPVAPRPRAVGL